MKFEIGATVMTDQSTGKAYARALSAMELNLVLAQLQALDDGKLKAIEIAPFMIRSVNLSEERAKEILAQKYDARDSRFNNGGKSKKGGYQ